MHSSMNKKPDTIYNNRDDVKKERQKLTLSVDKKVIQRARAEGINISAVTEKLLAAITLNHKEVKSHKSNILRAFRSYETAAENLKKVW